MAGRQLIIRKRQPDGTLAAPAAYAIRGVVWSPASQTTNTSPADPNNAAVRRPEFAAALDTDVPLLAAMHVNTVRMLLDPGADSAGRAVLDRLYESGIMAVMTVDDGVDDLARVQQAVTFYKDHPAILMWMLGNEWNICQCAACACSKPYYSGAAATAEEAAQRTQTAAALIKSIDRDHPVATSYGDIGSGAALTTTTHYINDVCPAVDVWGLNIYRGKSFGDLFAQWRALTYKPMLLGEFGTDAFRSAGSTSAGSVDGRMQADWNVTLWNELMGHLSARDADAVALGGFLFEFNDEWWKVSPAGSQQTGGYGGPHPDDFANEEYFGVVDIQRNPRAAYSALATAYDASYVPPGTRRFRVISRGAPAAEYSSQYGTAWFFQDGAKLFSATGGGGGGRGFNIAVIDPATGTLSQPVQHFDTYDAMHNGGNEFCAMNTFLDGLANGRLLLMGIADEGGLTQFPPNSCTAINDAAGCAPGTRQRLAALGSQQIQSYCYWDSWAMAAVQGEHVARMEARANGAEVFAETTLPTPMRTLSLQVNGSGLVRSVPYGPHCPAACSAAFELGAAVSLRPLPTAATVFKNWTIDCSGSGACQPSMTQDRSVAGTFEALPEAVGDILLTDDRRGVYWNAPPVRDNVAYSAAATGIVLFDATALYNGDLNDVALQFAAPGGGEIVLDAQTPAAFREIEVHRHDAVNANDLKLWYSDDNAGFAPLDDGVVVNDALVVFRIAASIGAHRWWKIARVAGVDDRAWISEIRPRTYTPQSFAGVSGYRITGFSPVSGTSDTGPMKSVDVTALPTAQNPILLSDWTRSWVSGDPQSGLYRGGAHTMLGVSTISSSGAISDARAAFDSRSAFVTGPAPPAKRRAVGPH